MNVGFGNMVPAEFIRAIIDPLTSVNRNPSAPVRRLRERAEKEGRLIDLAQGRKVRAVIVLDTNQIVLSMVMPETLWARWEAERRNGLEKDHPGAD